MTVVHLAARHAGPLLPLLLKKLPVGRGVDVLDRNGRTPLHWAAGAGQAELCRLLVRQGQYNFKCRALVEN